MSYLCNLYNKKKVCNLDEIYTIPQIKKIINNHPLELYNQMINERKGVKIFISEYDETEPEVIIQGYCENATCKHLAFVAEINTINIENQKKSLCNGKIVYNKEEQQPIIKKVLIDGVVYEKILINDRLCDIPTPPKELKKYRAKCSFKFYWLYKTTTFYDKLFNIKKKFTRGCCGSIDIEINQSLEELLPVLFNKTLSSIEDKTLKEISDELDICKGVNHLLCNTSPYVSSCNWIIAKKQIEYKEDKEETELTNFSDGL